MVIIMKDINFLRENSVDVNKCLEVFGDIETYNELIKMDKEALKVMFPRLNTKESGIKEMIQWTACREILGDEDLKLNVNTPYEWYSEYSSYILKIYNDNSKEYVEANYPKASILIELVEK